MWDVVCRIRGWFRRMREPWWMDGLLDVVVDDVVEEEQGPRPPLHVGCRCFLDVDWEVEIWEGMLVDMAEEIERSIFMGERDRELDAFWAELYEVNFGEDCSDH